MIALFWYMRRLWNSQEFNRHLDINLTSALYTMDVPRFNDLVSKGADPYCIDWSKFMKDFKLVLKKINNINVTESKLSVISLDSLDDISRELYLIYERKNLKKIQDGKLSDYNEFLKDFALDVSENIVNMIQCLLESYLDLNKPFIFSYQKEQSKVGMLFRDTFFSSSFTKFGYVASFIYPNIDYSDVTDSIVEQIVDLLKFSVNLGNTKLVNDLKHKLLRYIGGCGYRIFRYVSKEVNNKLVSYLSECMIDIIKLNQVEMAKFLLQKGAKIPRHKMELKSIEMYDALREYCDEDILLKQIHRFSNPDVFVCLISRGILNIEIEPYERFENYLIPSVLIESLKKGYLRSFKYLSNYMKNESMQVVFKCLDEDALSRLLIHGDLETFDFIIHKSTQTSSRTNIMQYNILLEQIFSGSIIEALGNVVYRHIVDEIGLLENSYDRPYGIFYKSYIIKYSTVLYRRRLHMLNKIVMNMDFDNLIRRHSYSYSDLCFIIFFHIDNLKELQKDLSNPLAVKLVNQYTNMYRSIAMVLESIRGNAKEVEDLIEDGANPKFAKGIAFFQALSRGNVDIAFILQDKGALGRDDKDNIKDKAQFWSIPVDPKNPYAVSPVINITP